MSESSIIFRPKRGEIYLCNLGKNTTLDQINFCPVMVIQANELNRKASTVVVAPLSAESDRTNNPCHVFLPVVCFIQD